MTNPNVLTGNQFGFIIYPSSFIKKPEDAWTTVRDIKKTHFDKHVHRAPLQFLLPPAIGGSLFSAPYDRLEALKHDQVGARLVSPEQSEFLQLIDTVANIYYGKNRTHLSGIGSWEDEVEPSMMTVFHNDISGNHLKMIGCDIGSYARQKAIMLFSPHRGGLDKLMHARVRTHLPVKQLTPRMIADISRNITGQFNNYFDKGPNGTKIPIIPGRTILPDTTGHSDILVGIGTHSPNATRVQETFKDISANLGQVQDVQYWPGTTSWLGGHAPYSDEENMHERDSKQREEALENYRRQSSHRYEIKDPEVTEAVKMAAMHSPARTGTVVRGIFYRPGAILPKIEAEPAKLEGKQDHPTPIKDRILSKLKKKRKGPDSSFSPTGVNNNNNNNNTSGCQPTI